MRTFAFLFLGLTLQAQSFRHVKLSGGFKIGTPLNEPTNYLPLYSTLSQGRWTGGPTVELHLPRNFSVEFDSLFRNYRSSTSYPVRLDPSVNAFLLNSNTAQSGTARERSW